MLISSRPCPPQDLEPSIRPSTFPLSFRLLWSFLSLYHGQLLQSLPRVPPCPFALHFILLFLLLHSPGRVQLPPPLGLMCSLLAGLPGSGSFLIRRSYQPPLGPLLCCSPAKPSLFPCSPSADGPAAEKTGACAHLPALAGCCSLRAHAFSLSPRHLYSGCRPPLLRRPVQHCSPVSPR